MYGMKKKIADNLAKFFYDCSKLSFAVLVIGVFAKKPFAFSETFFGLSVTLILASTGATIDAFKEEK